MLGLEVVVVILLVFVPAYVFVGLSVRQRPRDLRASILLLAVPLATILLTIFALWLLAAVLGGIVPD